MNYTDSTQDLLMVGSISYVDSVNVLRANLLFLLFRSMITQSDPDLQAMPRRELSAQRIDRPHALQNGHAPPSPAEPQGSDSSAVHVGQQDSQPSSESQQAWHESLLNLHAADLVQHLQRWSLEIDAREAQLNARSALQDLQERQFRQWSNSQTAEIEELTRAAIAHEHELRSAVRRNVIMETNRR